MNRRCIALILVSLVFVLLASAALCGVLWTPTSPRAIPPVTPAPGVLATPEPPDAVSPFAWPDPSPIAAYNLMELWPLAFSLLLLISLLLIERRQVHR